uniref:Uncharacterized protein n=1 Tax=Ovis aries TaxID=9940 RepID=A0AC11D813_SHEEP
MGAPRPVFPWGAALWAFLLASLGGAAGQPLGAEPMCTAQPLARYSVTFTGKWSQASFPKQYPLFRPPAQWSSLLGAAHSSDYSLWRKDQYVSNGLREFAERGEAWALMREMEAAGERLQSVHGVFSAPAVPSGTGQTSAELEAHARHSLVSFVVRIVPSPDWFVGVDSLDLCDRGSWREQVAVDLYPYDAGTDSGFTFSSPNFATVPQDTVTETQRRRWTARSRCGRPGGCAPGPAGGRGPRAGRATCACGRPTTGRPARPWRRRRPATPTTASDPGARAPAPPRRDWPRPGCEIPQTRGPGPPASSGSRPSSRIKTGGSHITAALSCVPGGAGRAGRAHAPPAFPQEQLSPRRDERGPLRPQAHTHRTHTSHIHAGYTHIHGTHTGAHTGHAAHTPHTGHTQGTYTRVHTHTSTQDTHITHTPGYTHIHPHRTHTHTPHRAHTSHIHAGYTHI